VDLWSDNPDGYGVKNIETIVNIKNIVLDKLRNDCVEDLNLGNYEWDESENENIDNYQLYEIMNDVAANFIDISIIFENLSNDSNIPLFSGCIKFMKISIIFKLYNLKAKMNRVIKFLPLYS
jgi:hypothetical protein